MKMFEFAATVFVVCALIAQMGAFLRPPKAALFLSGSAAAGCCALLALWGVPGGFEVVLAHSDSWGMRWQLRMDGLSAPLSVFVTGIASLVLLFAQPYMQRHLRETQRPRAKILHFSSLLWAFMLAMVVLFLADDLVLIFISLEITALTSFLLIAFDRDEKAWNSAKVALMVTAGSSLLFLVGALCAASRAETTVVSELGPWLEKGEGTSFAAVLMVTGVVAKSAQFPLHFWLPRAMVAPTPVSAYLHSAAMVAAGVFVLIRLHPLIESTPVAKGVLLTLGMASVLLGGLGALLSQRLKVILAYSTIAQFGYATVFVGWGGGLGLLGAVLFLVAHGVCKCPLFLTAGTLKSLLHIEKLSQGGGLFRAFPLLAISSGAAAAGLSGLPLTIGFFKDDLWFKAAHRAGPFMTIFSVVGAGLSFAYSARFWWRLFGGKSQRDKDEPLCDSSEARGYVLPICIFSFLIALGGCFPKVLDGTFVAAAESAASFSTKKPTLAESIHFPDLGSVEMLMAAGAWLSGALLFGMMMRFEKKGRSALMSLTSRTLSPAWLGHRVHRSMVSLSTTLHQKEFPEVRIGLTQVVVGTAAAVLLAWWAAQPLSIPLEPIGSAAPLLGALGFSALAAVNATLTKSHLSLILLVSFSGFGLALTVAILGAPNVALVVILIETLLTLILLAVITQIPPDALKQAERRDSERALPAGVSFLAAACVFCVSASSLAHQADRSVAPSYLSLADVAHAKDAVTAILTDFRGLDTVGELSVFVVSMLGSVALFSNRKVWKKP